MLLVKAQIETHIETMNAAGNAWQRGQAIRLWAYVKLSGMLFGDACKASVHYGHGNNLKLQKRLRLCLSFICK